MLLPGRVIAFVNFKGGVGKTANVVNVGACLAKYHGKKVMIVDLDAQCNSSVWLMKPEELERHNKDLSRCVYQIFRDKKGTSLTGLNYFGRCLMRILAIAEVDTPSCRAISTIGRPNSCCIFRASSDLFYM
jgi:hypothetical protein